MSDTENGKVVTIDGVQVVISTCHDASLQSTRGDGVVYYVCSAKGCGTPIMRIVPGSSTGEKEFLDGELPWTYSDNLRRVPLQ